MNVAPPALARRRATLARRALLAAVPAVLISGCATAPSETAHPADPFERWNRGVYSFNDGLDRAILRPTATFYGRVTPEPVRSAVHNFFGNFRDAWSAVNLFLQGRVGDALNDTMRVGVNTVFGLAGTLDVATEMRLDSHGQDFGLTLGHWGLKSGPYLVLPLLGPSTVRDTVALPFDRMAKPSMVFADHATTSTVLTVVEIIDTRHALLTLTDVLDDVAIDPYTFTRDGYLQRRQNLIDDGLDAPATDDDQSSREPLRQPATRVAANGTGAGAPGSAGGHGGWSGVTAAATSSRKDIAARLKIGPVAGCFEATGQASQGSSDRVGQLALAAP